MTVSAARALQGGSAGVALAFAATSLTGVLTGSRWWGYVVLTITVVVAAGALLRWMQVPPIVTATGQLAALIGLVTAVFTSSGWLMVLPGPAAVTELVSLLNGATQQIRVGLPPVAQSTELICLVVLALGPIALAVDTLAVSAAAPAPTGLLLLCVVAVPAAVSDQLLPWWTFVLSALGFALMLAVDSQRRQLAWGEAAGSGRHRGAAPAALAVTAGAIVVALLIGVTMSAVGTGRSTKSATRTGHPLSGIWLNPFTSLRGQLSAEDPVALLRIRGLGQRAYLRVLTLSRFTNLVGWQQGPLDGGIPADEEETTRLPLPAGVTPPITGPTLQVGIEPINYMDTWLPSFGYPLAITGIGPDWNYDPDAITIFSEHRQRAEPYTELGVLPQPDPRRLRAAGPAGSAPFRAADPEYLETGGVDPRVAQLARTVTAGSTNAFDATVTLNQWFTQPRNGFSYDLRTAPGTSGDALVDFLFTGHQGYCEQFASAMAIMLRSLHIPARVAIGFTPGTVTGSTRLITTEDAHAWVEAWFPGAGWLPFDPTPLTDGRTVRPPYVAAGAAQPRPAPSPQPAPPVTGKAAPPIPPPAALAAPPVRQPGTPGDPGSGAGVRIALSVLGLLGLAALAGLTPLGVRESRRRRRLHLVSAGGPQAVSAAWEEVLAESADRGVVPPVGETVRASADRLSREHALDEPGHAGLHILVGAVERSWYAGVRPPDPVALSTRDADRELCVAVDAVRASLSRCAPQNRMSRLLPRSVLYRRTWSQ
ncbi:MAG: transglutaminaseTgpA domain-containing protein [Pseudonocardiaceae bacterium]